MKVAHRRSGGLFVLNVVVTLFGLSGAILAVSEGHYWEAAFWTAVMASSGMAAARNRGWARES